LGWEDGDAAGCFFAAIAAAGAGCDGFEACAAVFALGATSVSLPSESKINWLEPNQNCRSVTRTTSSATRRSARARISLRGCELSRDTRACEVGAVGLGLSSSICVDPGSDATTIDILRHAGCDHNGTRRGVGGTSGPCRRQGPGSRVGRLQGAAVRCEGAAECAEARWRLVLLGAPGVGKGTPGDLLNQRLGLFIFSTSDIFRAAVRRAECEPTSAIREALGVHASWCSSPGFHGLGDGAGEIRLPTVRR
jgi:hypothetical protein